MDAEIHVREVGPPQRDLLVAMYDRFDPPGAAFGLPPHSAEGRRRWVGRTLGQRVNMAAFSTDGEVVGHCFLTAGQPGSAEMAVFVHQDSRRMRVGTALVQATLAWGAAAEMRRVWAVTPPDNRAALRLLMGCGFRLTRSDPEAELEIDLAATVNWCCASPGT